jgi:hypothetical protein
MSVQSHSKYEEHDANYIPRRLLISPILSPKITPKISRPEVGGEIHYLVKGAMA